ncbi:hypothetical protein LUZ62_083125 [Rhynchospora pubera]|uniref:DUF674 domain-containing protein n=1 Tax=Rhynchospora pubera TaxID=906938 RepID=A0AAV8BZX4_9POAL|nr:hypothetical protein LUZ62_083124 [Rhynchospora pubera]KAJ4748720.1 hypothetical protein LUZ62_083125 [Rhynchospora pubera]
MANANESKFALKLLIDKNCNKVLFGEAGKDFVDFIFSLLSLPLGAVTKLLTKDSMVGSIGEIYDSLSKLDENYVLSDKKVSSLLNPRVVATSSLDLNFLLPPATDEHSKRRAIYICSNTRQKNSNYYSPSSPGHYSQSNNASSICEYVSEVKGITCPGCNNRLDKVAQFVNPVMSGGGAVESEYEGFVEGVVTYSVMDDLTVVPMSTISSITLLNKFQIKDLGSLEERTVGVGFEEGLKLLKVSLQSKTVLTDVFLK